MEIWAENVTFSATKSIFYVDREAFMSFNEIWYLKILYGNVFTYDVPVPPNFLKLIFLLIKWRKPENQKSEMVSKGENESYELFSLLTTISH